MDLRTVDPMFNLYNYRWPLAIYVENLPPAKFVHDTGDRVGRALDSLVSNGVIVSGGLVRESVLSPGVRVNSWATIECSVLLHNTVVGRHAEIRKAIIDKHVVVPEGVKIGVDKEHDRARGFVGRPAASPWRARARWSPNEGRAAHPRVPAEVYGGAGRARRVPGQLLAHRWWTSPCSMFPIFPIARKGRQNHTWFMCRSSTARHSHLI